MMKVFRWAQITESLQRGSDDGGFQEGSDDRVSRGAQMMRVSRGAQMMRVSRWGSDDEGLQVGLDDRAAMCRDRDASVRMLWPWHVSCGCAVLTRRRYSEPGLRALFA